MYTIVVYTLSHLYYSCDVYNCCFTLSHYRLCFKARDPVRSDLIEAMGVEQLNIQVAAVCVYSSRVPDVVKALSEMKLPRPIHVASVAAGFPDGES